MGVLIQILLPAVSENDTAYRDVRSLLTKTFGGVTLHASAPAQGVWNDGEETEFAQIVVVEVMVNEVNRGWWQNYRQELEKTFEQEEIVIRAMSIDRL